MQSSEKRKSKEKNQQAGERLAYSLNEAAALLGVSNRHLAKQADAGEIRKLRCGGRILFSRKELERYIAANTR